MLAAIKDPGKAWRHVNFQVNLKNLNEVVGGYIEAVPNLLTEAVMYCNEEGKLHDLEPNFYVYQDAEMKQPFDIIVGSVIMFGPRDKDGNETDLTSELFEQTIKTIKDF